jgi:hypothetical protein
MEQNVTSASSKPPERLGPRRAFPEHRMALTRRRKSDHGDAGRRAARACAERVDVPPANALEPNDRRRSNVY